MVAADSMDFELITDGLRGRDTPATNVLAVGRDEVLLFGNKVVVCAAKEMPDWEARDFQRPKILFQGESYYVSRKFPGEREHPFRYELAPWPEYQEDPKHVIDYNEDYVAERDGRFKKVRPVTNTSTGLWLLSPLLGFFWSGAKRRILEPMGFNPLRISLASCLLAYAIFLGELFTFFFLAHGLLQRLLGLGVWLDYLCLLIFPLDAAVRFFQITNASTRYPDGLLEWAVKFRFKGRQ